MVDERDIPSAWGIALVDPSHLVFEYTTYDNEDPALAQLSMQASVYVPYIFKLLLMKYSKPIHIQ
jgi:hypothetical protein